MHLKQPKPSRNRTRRLRKKLHIGEFTEYGFNVHFSHASITTPENQYELFDEFIEHAIEAHQLSVGGGGSIQPDGITSYRFFAASYERAVGPTDPVMVRSWLAADARVDPSSIQIGPLVDCWYLDDAEIDAA